MNLENHLLVSYRRCGALARERLLVLTAAILLTVFGSGPFGSGHSYAVGLEQVVAANTAVNAAGVKSQKKIDSLYEQTDELVSQYRLESKRLEDLKIYNNQLQKQIDNQVKAIEELSQSSNLTTVVAHD